MDQKQQYSTFWVAGLYFGVPVRGVQEVLRYQEMTSVPLSPGTVQGLINLRGQIVTAIDMRRRLGLPERGGDALPMNVVLAEACSGVSLLVDEIGDVLEVEEMDFEPPPETLETRVRELIRGVYKLDGRLLLELDAEKTVALDSGETMAA
jgi:purine-binding chemotaxis protein CheW